MIWHGGSVFLIVRVKSDIFLFLDKAKTLDLLPLSTPRRKSSPVLFRLFLPLLHLLPLPPASSPVRARSDCTHADASARACAAEPYAGFCDMHRLALAISTIGKVRQVVSDDRIVSEVPTYDRTGSLRSESRGACRGRRLPAA